MSPFRCVEVRKSIESDRERLNSLSARLEARFRAAFNDYVARMQSEEAISALVRLLEQGRIDEAVRVFDGLAQALGTAFEEAFRAAATAEIGIVGAEAAAAVASRAATGTARLTVTPTFGGGHARAAEIIRTEGARLVKEVSEATQEVVRNVVSTGARGGVGPREIAREVRQSVGLTAREDAAVKNYERLLRENAKESLTRQLRSKRLDARIEAGKPLTEDEIVRLVESYRKNSLKRRAERIARTESLQAVSLGRIEAMNQTVEQLGLTANDVEKGWVASVDGRERDSHRALNGKTLRGMEATFGNGLRFPRDPKGAASEVIQCRCFFTMKISPQ